MFLFHVTDLNIAIIGDIVSSKQLNQRFEIQKKLKIVLDDINDLYSKEIASKFMITLGDEFQGLLKCGNHVIHIISEIEAKMYPVKIRFGIGLGEITTDINPDIPLGADGPAYHYARNAIEYLKENEKKSKALKADIKIVTKDVNDSAIILINSILSLGNVIKSKWTNRQREVIYDYLKHADSQKKVAERLGITQSSVQKSLAGSDYYSYKEAMDEVAKVLSEIRGENNV